ncbi:expressed unknown protein [Seminavis robusta]|uniref:Uncharacterized protein n=1 Tax=Seminavis robusta TaxID=568900 RepID=A0A9N8HJE4_9STRA|nr:expressed unknown protein [Seminavis robusta]|eukprot:Sro761_g198450.1 n/a (103) ;mRNA; f:678-1087
MKSFSALLLLVAPLLASAFAPASFASRYSTEIGPHRIDPESAHNQADNLDAIRVTYEECNVDGECVIVHGELGNDGRWADDKHVRGDIASQNVLMMECDDTE